MFVRVSVLFLVCVLCVHWIAAKRDSTGRDKKGNRQNKLAEIDDLKEAVAEIHERLEDGGSGCNSNVHFFFHSGDDHHHRESGDDDQHVHLHIHHDEHHEAEHGPHSDDDSVHTAHCEFHDNDSGLMGHAHFVQQDQDRHVNIQFEFDHLGAADSEFAVHIHEFGDLSNDCDSIGGHFDDNMLMCDLGTLTTDSDGGVQSVWNNDTSGTLFTRDTIVGRSVAISADGSKVGCCVIGWGMAGEHDHHEHHAAHIEHYAKMEHGMHMKHEDHGHH